MKRGAVVWITGRPSAGKSTFAARLHVKLEACDHCSVVLDSDELRQILQTHDYSPAGRSQFYLALGLLAARLAEQGVTVLVAATAHRREYREHARRISPRYIEVYVATSAQECMQRDTKGLYAAARQDPGVMLPGAAIEYEPPAAPDVIAAGGLDEHALDAVVRLLSADRR
jgi:adenylylsulfate kinase